MHELKFNNENTQRGHVLIKVRVKYRRAELKLLIGKLACGYATKADRWQ